MVDRSNGSKFLRLIRDPALLDALEKVRQQPYTGIVWRSVREGRDPLACWRSGGRWDDGTFDVLYTSETREAAREERRFHLYQGQPIPPSKVRYELFELRVSLEAVMVFDDLDRLATLGLDISRYGQLSYFEREQEYPRSQDVAEACSFLGSDGIIVPSARDKKSNNLIIFCDQETKIEKEIVNNHGIINFTR
jgi:RES domain-containing protein